MTVAMAADQVRRALRWDRVEVKYVDPGRAAVCAAGGVLAVTV
jgi:hypothetical protein